MTDERKKAIDAQVDSLRERLGCKGVIVIGIYEDGEMTTILEAGDVHYRTPQVYYALAQGAAQLHQHMTEGKPHGPKGKQ